MPPRGRYRRPSAPPGEKGGGGYVAPSKPKPFVDKRVTKSVSTSDVATGKFTGGTQRATPKPKPDKTFTKIAGPIQGLVSPPVKKVIPKDIGRETAIKKYATTGLESLGEHRKKEVEKILSSGQADITKRKEIKKRNLRGAIPGLLKKVTEGKDLFVPASQSPFTELSSFRKHLKSIATPLANRMTYDANNIWGSKTSQSDAMRHLMWTAIHPNYAAAHEYFSDKANFNSPGNIQDMHNNLLKTEVIRRAIEFGGTSYENIRKAAFDMVNEQEARMAQGLPLNKNLPITSNYYIGNNNKTISAVETLYPNITKKEYTDNLLKVAKENIKTEALKQGQKYNEKAVIDAVKSATKALINWVNPIKSAGASELENREAVSEIFDMGTDAIMSKTGDIITSTNTYKNLPDVFKKSGGVGVSLLREDPLEFKYKDIKTTIDPWKKNISIFWSIPIGGE